MAFTPIFWDGFEDGSLSRWDTALGMVRGESPKYGSMYYYGATGDGVLKKSFTSQSEIYASFWHQFPWIKVDDPSQVYSVREGTSTVLDLIGKLSADGNNIEVQYSIDGGTTYIVATNQFDKYFGDWMHVEVRVKVGAAGIVQVKIDDTLILDISPDLSAFTGIDNVSIDTPNIGTYDNFIIGTGDWPGNLMIGTLYPSDDGDVNEWSPSIAGNHYELVDNVDPALHEFAIVNEAGKRELFKLGNIGFNLDKILGVVSYCFVEKSGANVPKNAKHVVRIGSTDYDSDQFAVPLKGVRHRFMVNNPATGAQWTQSELENAQIGILSAE